jgi:hypothetical protein
MVGDADDTSAAYYRAQADRVLGRAEVTRSDDARRMLMDSVALYRHLATLAERGDGGA